MIYHFTIYNRNGACLFHEKWHTGKTVNYSDPEEEKRLLFGLIFSLKEFVQKIAPVAQTDPFSADHATTPHSDGLQRYQTKSYTCHHYETPSGLRFILFTDNNAGDLTTVLKYIYSHYYIDFVVTNPLSNVNSTKAITSQLFRTQVKQYLENLPCFR
ncbi:TPA: hypothetical protein N0F65_005985 [Lagenidium giganteum]|uniref:Trafficking protein particle complex subunit n=1 Tax=Lagenidium giganteum TaxID=4803 RepID=A0AAV2ZCP2_9STRA|nr:TPA: hypothetical protein N0F65_005985 [Lagenidium giganteum]